jgi:FkbM family methyltransferase
MPPQLGPRTRALAYPRTVAQRENCQFTVRAQTGSPFTGSTSDFVAWTFGVLGYFNWRNVAIARTVCGEGDVILEVGANIGTETVCFSDIVGKTGVVHAFEPFPPNLAHLRSNAAQARHGNINIFPLALGDHDEVIRFASPPGHNSGRGHVLSSQLNQVQSWPATEVVEVQCKTLDSIGSELGEPRLMLVDAEGQEAAILRGAQHLLAAGSVVIVIEVLDRLLARAGSSPAELARYLWGFDYRLFEIARFRIMPIEGATIPSGNDWLAVPRSASGVIGRIQRGIHRSGMLPLVTGLNPLRG